MKESIMLDRRDAEELIRVLEAMEEYEMVALLRDKLAGRIE